MNVISKLRQTKRNMGLKKVSVLLFVVCSVFNSSYLHAKQAERFKNTEIRVIRPRYFNKAKRFELGAAMNMVMNESFIYTFMATGLAAFHFSETWAIEGTGSFGFSVDKSDKRILFDKFDIKTEIVRTQYQMEGVLQYTPLYGKWQFGSGRLIYFDTFVAAGGGMTGVNWKYSDFCETPDIDLNPDAETPPVDTTQAYPTFVGGIGQRYFVNKSLSYRWDFKYHTFMYNTIDSECAPETVLEEVGGGIDTTHSTITIQIGASKYF